MGIFSRLTDIVNANLNSLLDKAEDPEKMVRLMIMEMEETLVEVRSSSARIIADKKTLQRKQAQLVEMTSEWEAKAEIAIERGREDLARAALGERRRLQEDVQMVTDEVADLEQHLAKLNEEVGLLQNKLADAKAKQKSLAVRAKTARNRLDMRQHLRSDAIADSMAKFETYERRLDELEGEVESFDIGRQDLADEISALKQDEEIDAELAALKQRVKSEQN